MTNFTTYQLKKEWFELGLEYALKSWTSTFNRMGKPNPYSRIEKIILGLIAENAVEQYLIDNNIPYDTTGKTRWYEEDRYDIGIGKYAVDVKANFIDIQSPFIQSQWNSLFESKDDWYNECHALVPLDQFNPAKSDRRKSDKKEKVYIFPFIEGEFHKNNDSNRSIHAFWDYRWLKKGQYKDLPERGKLNITCDGKLTNCKLLIYGTTDEKNLVVEEIEIKNRNFTSNRFYQVFSIFLNGKLPTGIIKVHSNELQLTERILPNFTFELNRDDSGNYFPSQNNWQNIEIYNCSIKLLGWIKESRLRIIGRQIPRFTHTLRQYQETKVDNWGCIISELNPMNTLNELL